MYFFCLFQGAFDGILKLTTVKGYSLGDIVQVGAGGPRATNTVANRPFTLPTLAAAGLTSVTR